MGVKRQSAPTLDSSAVEEPPLGYPQAMRGQVWWVDLDPTIGSEIRKRRPAVIVSPDDMNLKLHCVIVAPLTSQGRPLGCRPEVRFKGKRARILLDQIRSIDKARLVGLMGQVDQAIWKPVLLEMFA
jgi:mRNA interferase MazF